MRIVLSLLLLLSLNVAAQESVPAPEEKEHVSPPIESKESKGFEKDIYFSAYVSFGGGTDAVFEDASMRVSGQTVTGKYKINGAGGYVLGADLNFKFESGFFLNGAVERISISGSGDEITIDGGGTTKGTKSSSFSVITPMIGVGWAWTNVDLFLALGPVVSASANDAYKDLEPTFQGKLALRYRFEKLYISLTSRTLHIPDRTFYYGADSITTGTGNVHLLDIGLGYRFK